MISGLDGAIRDRSNLNKHGLSLNRENSDSTQLGPNLIIVEHNPYLL